MPGRRPRLARLRPALGTLVGGVALASAIAGGARGDDDPLHCLAMAIYWEAKGCSRDDMAAVGWVVLNRAAQADFPDALCAVIKEGGEQPPCQFSWWCDGKGDAPDDPEAWQEARGVAAQLRQDPPPDPTGGALFFHSNDIDNPWGPERERTAQIGCLTFYR